MLLCPNRAYSRQRWEFKYKSVEKRSESYLILLSPFMTSAEISAYRYSEFVENINNFKNSHVKDNILEKLVKVMVRLVTDVIFTPKTDK